jgi:hypothetical protein
MVPALGATRAVPPGTLPVTCRTASLVRAALASESRKLDECPGRGLFAPTRTGASHPSLLISKPRTNQCKRAQEGSKGRRVARRKDLRRTVVLRVCEAALLSRWSQPAATGRSRRFEHHVRTIQHQRLVVVVVEDAVGDQEIGFEDGPWRMDVSSVSQVPLIAWRRVAGSTHGDGSRQHLLEGRREFRTRSDPELGEGSVEV